MIQLFFFLLPVFILTQNPERFVPGSSKAVVFLNSLNEEQKRKTVFPFDEMNRYEWHYLPASLVSRNGISVKELNEKQKQNLYSLMKAYLSQRGFDRTKNIMAYEYLLKELQSGNSSRIPEDYFVAVYGSPGRDSTWGWKYSGHHIALNFTIVNGQLAFAPFFFGVYPAEPKEGSQKGMRVIKDEEDLGFELVNSLDPEQKQKAIFRAKCLRRYRYNSSQRGGTVTTRWYIRERPEN